MPDDPKNIEEMEAEARKGNTAAQTFLGISYLYGLDGEMDHAKALAWLTKATEAGASRAVLNLGRMYEEGLGTARDAERARQLYERAARAGEFFACVFLARCHRNGTGGPIDEGAAYTWYRRAADNRDRIRDCPEMNEAMAFVEAYGS